MRYINERGSALLAVIAVSVVGAIIALGLGTMFVDSYQQEKIAQRKVAVSELGDQIKNVFASPGLCKCNFQTISFPVVAGLPTSTTLTSLKYFDSTSCTTGSSFLDVGQVIPGDTTLKIASMTLKNPVVMPGNAVSADLEIAFALPLLSGQLPHPYTIPNLMFLTNPATMQISDCISVANVQADNGSPSNYDPPSMCGTDGAGHTQFCWNHNKVAFTNESNNPVAATLVSATNTDFEIMFATAAGRNVLFKLHDTGSGLTAAAEPGWRPQLCYAHNSASSACGNQNYYGLYQVNCASGIKWSGTYTGDTIPLKICP